MQNNYYMKRNEVTSTPYSVIYFDTESDVKIFTDAEIVGMFAKELKTNERILSGYESPHELKLIGAMFVDYTSTYEYKFREFKHYDIKGENDIFTFWRDVARFAEQRRKVYMYAHNVAYDLIVSKGLRYLRTFGYVVPTTNPFFSFEKPFFVDLKSINGDEIKIRDSLAIYNASLKEIGKAFKLDKLETTFNNYLSDEGRIYNRRDVEILEYAMREFFKFVKEQDLGRLGVSVSNQAMNAFRHRFMDVKILHNSGSETKNEYQAYYGGRNEMFMQGEFMLKDLDVNSMYPYVMRNFAYPVKYISKYVNVDIETIKRLLDEGRLLIGHFFVNANKDTRYIPYRYKGKLIFPVGFFESWISTPEIRQALDDNIIQMCDVLLVYNGTKIFEEYVNFFYSLKVQAKKDKNDVLKTMTKLFLNGLYGKFAQRSRETKFVEHRTDYENKLSKDIIHEIEIGKDDINREIYFNIYGDIYKSSLLHDPANYAVPAIGVHITAYARMQLWQYMKQAGLDNVYYCDTDSLFVNDAGYERMKDFLDENELGKLKIEKQGKFIIRGLKDYKFLGEDSSEEDKIKGVSKKAVRVKLDTDTVNKAYLQKEGDIYVQTQWPTFAGLLGKDCEKYSTRLVVKVISHKYEKGYVLADGSVKPYDLTDEYMNMGKQVQEEIVPVRDIKRWIVKAGGISTNIKKDYPDHRISTYLLRKHGRTLDDLVTEVNNVFKLNLTEQDLYDLLSG